MPPTNSEQDKFLEETNNDNLLEQSLNLDTDNTEQETEADDEEAEQKLRNRRERRMAEKLQAEREANIALSTRLQTISETQKFRGETEPSEYLKQVERIYGSGSPEATEATNLLKSAFQGVEERATERALEMFRQEQEKNQTDSVNAIKEAESTLDDFVDSIEDTFNVSMTQEQEKGFFRLLERLSPKDSNGDIVDYADPISTWEIYQEKISKKDTRAKDLSSRSMVQSGASKDSTIQDDATVRFLKENGII